MWHEIHLIGAEVFQAIETHKGMIVIACGWAGHVGIPSAFRAWQRIGGKAGIKVFIDTGKLPPLTPPPVAATLTQ